jgi:hypothetical protein
MSRVVEQMATVLKLFGAFGVPAEAHDRSDSESGAVLLYVCRPRHTAALLCRTQRELLGPAGNLAIPRELLSHITPTRGDALAHLLHLRGM